MILACQQQYSLHYIEAAPGSIPNLLNELAIEYGGMESTYQHAFALAHLTLIVRDMALTLLEKRYHAQRTNPPEANPASLLPEPENKIDINQLKTSRLTLNKAMQAAFPEMSWFRAIVIEPLTVLIPAGLTAYVAIKQFAPEWFMQTDEDTSISDRRGEINMAAILGAAGLTFYATAKQVGQIKSKAARPSQTSIHREVEQAVAKMSAAIPGAGSV